MLKYFNTGVLGGVYMINDLNKRLFQLNDEKKIFNELSDLGIKELDKDILVNNYVEILRLNYEETELKAMLSTFKRGENRDKEAMNGWYSSLGFILAIVTTCISIFTNIYSGDEDKNNVAFIITNFLFLIVAMYFVVQHVRIMNLEKNLNNKRVFYTFLINRVL